MKTTLLIATLGLLAASTGQAFAQSGHDAGHSHHMAQSAAPTNATAARMSEGTVKKVDKSAAKITIAHGPLENLGMPGMTMAFRAADAAMLDKVKAGDKIRFTAERVDGVFSVTQLEVTK